MSLLSHQLQAFIAVAERGTVHGAAKDLRITQTGVTQRLRVLESTLGTTLFTRSRRGMILTAEGEALLRYCQAARELEGQAMARIQGAGKLAGTRIFITGPTSILSSRVVPQCIPVLEMFPNLLVSFNVIDLEDRLEDLRTATAQLAIVPKEQVVREVDSKALRAENYLLVATSKWKGRTLRNILEKERIIDFDSTDRMTHSYLKKFELLDFARPERHFVNNNEALIEMFRRGLGFGVLTSEVAKPYLDSKELMTLNGGSAYKNELALAWYPRAEMPPYFSALIKAIK